MKGLTTTTLLLLLPFPSSRMNSSFTILYVHTHTNIYIYKCVCACCLGVYPHQRSLLKRGKKKKRSKRSFSPSLFPRREDQ